MRIFHALVAALLLLPRAAFAGPAAEIVATGLDFPEGPVFVGQDLYFVDYTASTVYRLDGHRAAPVWHQSGCGANGLVPYGDGLLVACYDGGTFQAIAPGGAALRTIDRDLEGGGFDRPNDLARDGRGGVYLTASGGDGGTPGKVYYLARAQPRPRVVAGGFQNANGVALSPDGRVLYLAESGTDKVLSFDVAVDGSLKNRRDFLLLDALLAGGPGARHTPDGLRTDAAGRLFVGLYNGRGFAVFDAGGRLLADVPLPGEHHASLALSPDGQFVYGTIADGAPVAGHAGALFRMRNPVAP
ncbi:SMP-30/gluconolactonase/LRE family protein [Cupriavidus sp. 30B13]|uniref:SMP-30/gluconolactonase/LRE family protein n=1 Tax=Cupriavidus sp. 30B13 TaxID=3384241 RepID=UPI003B8EFE36